MANISGNFSSPNLPTTRLKTHLFDSTTHRGGVWKDGLAWADSQEKSLCGTTHRPDFIYCYSSPPLHAPESQLFPRRKHQVLPLRALCVRGRQHPLMPVPPSTLNTVLLMKADHETYCAMLLGVSQYPMAITYSLSTVTDSVTYGQQKFISHNLEAVTNNIEVWSGQVKLYI